jgi:hypothetical protein
MLPARPILAAYAQALTRSVLLALGLDHALISFLAHTTVRAATALVAIVPRRHRRPAPIRDRLGLFPISPPFPLCNSLHIDNLSVRGQNDPRSSSAKGIETGSHRRKERIKCPRFIFQGLEPL